MEAPSGSVLILFVILVLFVLLLIAFTAEQKQKQRTISKEESRRRKRCLFNDGITREEFEAVAKKACENVTRLKWFKVCGTVVHGEVTRQKDNTTWRFDLDFNDNGHLTGRYWKYTENVQSGVPDYIGGLIQEALDAKGKSYEINFTHKDISESVTDYSDDPVSSALGAVMALVVIAFLLLVLGQP